MDLLSTAHSVREALRLRVFVDDDGFDQLYPEHVRRLSRLHWTPMSVALRAAALLAPDPEMSVLDLGAGPGKLCCVGALTCGGTWRGIEADPSLVAAATAAASALDIAQTTDFAVGDLTAVEWGAFDSLYLYNPFEARLFSGSPGREPASAFADQVARLEQRLAQLPTGTRVVAFHGFGGEMPASYSLEARELTPDGELALWIQRSR